MSFDENFSWNALTPAREPAGALISAGKSGKVLRSFPTIAVVSVKRPPVNCIPSPESPANRITASSIVLNVFPIVSNYYINFFIFEKSVVL